MLDKLTEVVAFLHANGYRLRSLGTDMIQVVDATKPGVPDEAAPEREDPEQDLWSHVGGRPEGLRRIEAAKKTSYADEDLKQ